MRHSSSCFANPSKSCASIRFTGSASGLYVCTSTRPGSFPRPAEPIAIDEGLRPHDDARAQSPSLAYRARVGSHDFRGAYAILSRHPALAGDTVKELLVAADVARLSEHPAEAVAYLQRIVREHPRDERAHQAAFTLGRTLSGLGRTKEAMSVFGQPARRLAGEYERDYPNGQRREEVRRHARLE